MDGCSVAELPAERHKEGDAVDKENVNGQEDISVQVQELPWDLDQVAHHRHRLSPGGLAFECIDAFSPDGVGDVNVFGCDGTVRYLFHLDGIAEVSSGGVTDSGIQFYGFLCALDLSLGVVLLVPGDCLYKGYSCGVRVQEWSPDSCSMKFMLGFPVCSRCTTNMDSSLS